MSQEPKQTVFRAVQTAIGQFANVDPEDVNEGDHLQEDLFIDPSTDLPKIIAHVMTELDIDIDPDLITDLISEIEEDPNKATVEELVAFVKDELEFN
jgi:acyl carrier protein